MRHSYQCPLRWSDMDAFGHVNNAVYLRYLEEARIDFMTRSARAAVPGSFTGGTVVARHEIEYRRPLVHQSGPVTVELWVTELKAASITFAYEIRDPQAGAGPYARAKTVVVPYNLKEKNPRRLTEGERSFLERYFDDSVRG